MTLHIDLTKEKERALQEEAKRRGMTASDYARMLLEKNLSLPPSVPSFLTKGMFPEFRNVSEEDFQEAKQHSDKFEF